MGTKRRILIVTTLLPYPVTGADQSDRTEGFRQLVRLGYDIRVIAMNDTWHTPEVVEKFRTYIGAPVEALPYEYLRNLSWKKKLRRFFRMLMDPRQLDASAYEYSETHVQEAVRRNLVDFKPDILWLDYTFLWPLFPLAKAAGVPCITRSYNFEAEQFLEEYGRSLKNYIKYLPKLMGEKRMTLGSAHLFAITPKEEGMYRAFGTDHVSTLPLRGLANCLMRTATSQERKPLKAVFMAGTYSVPHNLNALRFFVKEVVPRVNAAAPGAFEFHVTGKNVPEDFKTSAPSNIRFEGHINDLEGLLVDMDLAVSPSLNGAGMQQKFFEPLCRKIPMVASPRALAGYPFKDGEHYLGAETADEFATSVVALQDFALRKRLAENAYVVASKVFSREASDAIIQHGLEAALA